MFGEFHSHVPLLFYTGDIVPLYPQDTFSHIELEKVSKKNPSQEGKPRLSPLDNPPILMQSTRLHFKVLTKRYYIILVKNRWSFYLHASTTTILMFLLHAQTVSVLQILLCNIWSQSLPPWSGKVSARQTDRGAKCSFDVVLRFHKIASTSCQAHGALLAMRI